MTQHPADPASASTSAYSRPWFALIIAVLGFAGTFLIVSGYPRLRAQWTGLPDWAGALIDLAVINVPLVIAVLAAGVAASKFGIGRATGIRHWRWIDLVYGIGVGLVLRALVELVTPTTGSLGGPLGGMPPLAVTVVIVVGAVVISPFVEEWFFRGLVLRALLDALGGLGRWVAAAVAVAVSAAGFAALHFATVGAAVPLPLLLATLAVGVACGVLTVVTGRLRAAVFAHVVFNAIGVGLLLV